MTRRILVGLLALSLMAQGATLCAFGKKPKVEVAPTVIVINEPEGVVEFKQLEMTSRDCFTITRVYTTHRRVNVGGVLIGLESKSHTYHVYLAAVLKPGHYEDTVMIEIKGAPAIRIPVIIDIPASAPR